jgi:TPP-dependent 2-oxoacid decarboxylase
VISFGHWVNKKVKAYIDQLVFLVYRNTGLTDISTGMMMNNKKNKKCIDFVSDKLPKIWVPSLGQQILLCGPLLHWQQLHMLLK